MYVLISANDARPANSHCPDFLLVPDCWTSEDALDNGQAQTAFSTGPTAVKGKAGQGYNQEEQTEQYTGGLPRSRSPTFSKTLLPLIGLSI